VPSCINNRQIRAEFGGENHASRFFYFLAMQAGIPEE
jgi:hypothetical protein